MTASELIQETVDFYSADTTRRSIGSDGLCVYQAPNGNMCAVGRCMTAEAATENAKSSQSVDELDNLDSILQPKYRGHSTGFWENLQFIHDAGGNWNAQGITDQGKERVQYMLDKYND